jgi:hypothetical protein
MLKSQIVPPVCPSCPACPSTGICQHCGGNGGCGTLAMSGNTLVNGNSPIELVVKDRKNKSIIDETGKVLNKTVDAAGNIVVTTVDSAGNVVTKTIDTAGNIVNKTLDTAGGIVNKTVDTAGDIIGGAGDKVAGLFKSDPTQINYDKKNQGQREQGPYYGQRGQGQYATYGGTDSVGADSYSRNSVITAPRTGNFLPTTADFSAFRK